MKWVLIAALACLVAAYAFWQRNAVKTSYVNGLAPYTNLPGRDYILQQDCYIFKLKHRSSDWPFLGTHAVAPELPEAVRDSLVGTETEGARILGVLKVGDHFKVVSVRRDQSRTQTVISFEVILADESTRRYPRLDAYWIMDHSGDNQGLPPSILPAYAVIVGKE
jgi:hypothetical protein